MTTNESIISLENIVTRFGDNFVHNGVSFKIAKGSITAIIGGSGTGKSTLLREITGLLQPTSGKISLFGKDITQLSEEQKREIRSHYGVLFQNGALFSGLSVAENISAVIKEYTTLPPHLFSTLIDLRLTMAGLAPEVKYKMPNELSGGMKKRVALARALALEPKLIFLDEPTSGLDPINARAFDELISTLSKSLELTVFMVTHDLDSILSIADRIIVLGEGKVIVEGDSEKVANFNDPWVKDYFSSTGHRDKKT
jgi:phospholipid/cholesterol/gamma-HCH transport system ATP-binding protein